MSPECLRQPSSTLRGSASPHGWLDRPRPAGAGGAAAAMGPPRPSGRAGVLWSPRPRAALDASRSVGPIRPLAPKATGRPPARGGAAGAGLATPDPSTERVGAPGIRPREREGRARARGSALLFISGGSPMEFVHEVTAYLEHKPGRLAKICSALAQEKVEFRALSVMET